jgi:NitT/TauT family transport system ATP-binding protein
MLDQIKPSSSLLDIRSVCRSFPKGSGEDLLVLDKVDLTIHSGEIVGLLGRSGSGKSTLLRIIAGLVTPSSGEAKCRGEVIKGPPNGVAMVFQSFALFPWLTSPRHLASPEEGVTRPAMMRNSVDLPEPERPSRPTISPE